MTAPQAATRLLYIDDDAALCRLIERGLARRGYEVRSFQSGAEGVAAAANGAAFDVVAVDHYMPGMDGLETLQALRKLPGFASPVVYVTGSDESRLAVAALKAGAADYVVKSGSDDFTDLLASSLRQAVEQVRLRRERDAATEALSTANARLEKIVEHQMVLLREVNHRVANSLQLVSSLVHMQRAALTDTAAREALSDTQARIGAIMQIHRRLYTSDDVQSVDMQDYLSGLVAELEQSLPGKGGARLIRLTAEPIKLNPDKAVSLGVVVTELVTNAFKYAYAEGEKGEVRVALGHDPDRRIRLVVEDDGVGFSPGGPVQGSGLGQVVVAAMARSLDSKVEFDSAYSGARAVLSFNA